MDFTAQERTLICLYDPGTREGLIAELSGMMTYLAPDETDLRELAESVIGKLRRMTDEAYARVNRDALWMDMEEDHAG